jgi:hypothetical protein
MRSPALGNNSPNQHDNTDALLTMLTSTSHHNADLDMACLHVLAQHQSWLPPLHGLECELYPTATTGSTSPGTLTHMRKQGRDMSPLNKEILHANYMYISGGVSTRNNLTWRQPATAFSDSNPAYPYESTLWLYLALLGIWMLLPAQKIPHSTLVVVLALLLSPLCMMGVMHPTPPTLAITQPNNVT